MTKFNLEEVRDALKLIKTFQQEKNLNLLNNKGLEDFKRIYKKYEAQLKIKNFIQETVAHEIEPLQRQNESLQRSINSLLDKVNIQKQPKEVVVTPPTVQEVIPISEEKVNQEIDEVITKELKTLKPKEEPKEEPKVETLKKGWKVEKTPDLDVYTYENGHVINVIKKADGKKLVNVDGEGLNEELESDDQLESIKRHVEEM
jgi:hypothetical protein